MFHKIHKIHSYQIVIFWRSLEKQGNTFVILSLNVFNLTIKLLTTINHEMFWSKLDT